MNPNTADKMLLNTDFPLDKILANFSGSFAIGARLSIGSPRQVTTTFPHNIGDWGLIEGVYTTNGTTWLQFGVNASDTTGSQPVYQTVEVTAYCTTTDITVVASNYLATGFTINYALQLLSRE